MVQQNYFLIYSKILDSSVKFRSFRIQMFQTNANLKNYSYFLDIFWFQ